MEISEQSKRSGANIAKEIVIAWLESKLREKGFEVKRGMVVEGEGIKHVLDLVAEMHPLPSITISIGIIVLDREARVDDVEKLMGWKEELPLTKFVIVPLGGIDGSAYALALKHGIDVVVLPEDMLKGIELSKIISHEIKLCRHIEPVVPVDRVVEKLRDRVKPSFFKRSRGHIKKLVLIFVPLIESRIEVAKTDVMTGEVEVLEGKTVFDGLHGYAVRGCNGSVDVYREYGSFTDIPIEALEVLRVLSEEQSIELGTLAGRVGIGIDKLKPILEVLAARGLIDLYGDLVEFKGLSLDMFADIDSLIMKYSAPVHSGEPSADEKRLKLELMVPLPKLEDIMMSLRAKVLEMKITYYPLYVALIAEVKNGTVHEKLVVYDALSGEEVEGFSVLLAEPDIIDRVKEMKGFAEAIAEK